MSPLLLAAIALFLPGAMAVLLGVVYPLRRSGRPAALLSILAAVVSVGAAIGLALSGTTELVHAVRWLPTAGGTLADAGIRIDGISMAMLLVVTIVALCVQVFSFSYLADEPKEAFGRYFTYQSLFLFSMSLLVLSPNLLQLFVGWELVGATSYLLIGFWFKKPSAARASLKAFWVTKLADSGFVMALVVLYAASGQLGWNVTLAGGAATAVTALLFLAVMGKSAQVPLHVWLPDAMEGPTPVSALLHAATMVAAGVYLIVRAAPLFVQAPDTQLVMTYLGAGTALFAGVVALVQTDIKKVLAYSTCSQLGIMVSGLGAGSTFGGFFHLTTHAFFKALLFLAAGSVIHAVHSNELSHMGGLRKKMPWTALTFGLGALALAAVPGTSGFFSKDTILEAVAAKGNLVAVGALIVTSALTAFYMGRVFFLAFTGAPSEHAAHAHESGGAMLGPLFLLSVPAVALGFFASQFGHFLHMEVEPFHLGGAGVASMAAGLLGLALSWLIFGARKVSESAFAPLAGIGNLARASVFDRLYLGLYRQVGMRLAAAVGWFDRYVIDALVNATGWLVMAVGSRLRVVQTGNVQDYVFVVLAAACVLAVFGAFS